MLPTMFWNRAATVLLVAALMGCASPTSFESSVLDTAVHRIDSLDIQWNPVLPRQFRVTRIGERGYKPTHAELDKDSADARDALGKLVAGFTRGVLAALPARLRADGVGSVNARAVAWSQTPRILGRHLLNLEVSGMESACNGPVCSPAIEVRGELIEPGKTAPTYSFTVRLVGGGQSDAALFGSFYDALRADLAAKGFFERK